MSPLHATIRANYGCGAPYGATILIDKAPMEQPLEQPPEQVDRHQFVRQYSLAQILGVWAAAAVPMGVLAWIVAPWLRDQLGGEDPFAEALLICITAGLIWQFVLVLILTRRELAGLQWSRVREALWLRAPRDPKSGRVGGRVWLWVVPFVVLFALEAAVAIPGPSVRDFGDFVDSDRGEDFFRGAWGWFAVVVVLVVFNTVLGEELLFRGLLLPRMKGAFGRYDWVGNGALFAVYHLHTPWVIPTSLVDIFALAYPSRRFESAWMGIVVHSVQSVVVIVVVLTLVLG
jgi:CAAX protease family protein